MKLYFMKQSAIDFLKANMRNQYMFYFRYSSNEWLYDLFDYDPFEFFIDVPDFTLSPISTSLGETDLENCKRLYTNLRRISESQASDERLWAGLCNGVFYQYVRLRWNYSSLTPKAADRDASTVISRFFFAGAGNSGKYRNTLARYWWVGRTTYEPEKADHWVTLDKIGPEDFATKVNDIFYSNTFAANPEILHGISDAIDFFRQKNQKITVKDHLRPALQYLNALGGGILLDALTSDEISSIIREWIGRLLKGDVNDFLREDDASDEYSDNEDDNTQADAQEVNVDYQEEQEAIDRERETVDVNEVLDAPKTVERGCTVVVNRQPGNKEVLYKIPSADSHERQLYTIEQLMLGKRVGDSVRIRLDTYTIKEIRW